MLEMSKNWIKCLLKRFYIFQMLEKITLKKMLIHKLSLTYFLSYNVKFC
jgi:hypothetical protein